MGGRGWIPLPKKFDQKMPQTEQSSHLSSKSLGFFTSEAPPLSQLNSWDVTSEQNVVRKQRGWVIYD